MHKQNITYKIGESILHNYFAFDLKEFNSKYIADYHYFKMQNNADSLNIMMAFPDKGIFICKVLRKVFHNSSVPHECH